MPYTTAWERRGVVWRYWGTVSGEEILRSNQEIYGDARFDEMDYQIVDFTSVERFEVTEEDMVVMAANDRAAALTNPSVLVAVAARDALIKDLSALYEAETAESPWQHSVFESVEDARAWATRG
jgi:hypothetical protein